MQKIKFYERSTEVVLINLHAGLFTNPLIHFTIGVETRIKTCGFPFLQFFAGELFTPTKIGLDPSVAKGPPPKNQAFSFQISFE